MFATMTLPMLVGASGGEAFAQSFQCTPLEFEELQTYETNDLVLLACRYESKSQTGYEVARLYTQPPANFETASEMLSVASLCNEEKMRILRLLKARDAETATCSPKDKSNDDPFKDVLKN